MSESDRPWHGADNPFEALWQHIESKFGGGSSNDLAALKAQIDALDAKVGAMGSGLPTSAEVAELKADLAALQRKLSPEPVSAAEPETGKSE
jgi:Tfp pilus assembly protein PilO